MPYSIGLYFDSQTDQLIRNKWQELREKKLADYYDQSGNRPHITLSIFNFTDIEKARAVLAEISQSIVTFPLSFQQIGIFPAPAPAVFWAPVIKKEFLEFQSCIHHQFCEFSILPDFDFYTPDHWVPHCGLAMEINESAYIPKIVESCLTLPNMHTAWIKEIGLISFRPVRQLICLPLTSK